MRRLRKYPLNKMKGAYIHQSLANYHNTISSFGRSRPINVRKNIYDKLTKLEKESESQEKRILSKVVNKRVADKDIQNILNPNLSLIQKEINNIFDLAIREMEKPTRTKIAGKRKPVINGKGIVITQRKAKEISANFNSLLRELEKIDYNNLASVENIRTRNKQVRSTISKFNRASKTAIALKRPNGLTSIGVDYTTYSAIVDSFAEVLIELEEELMSKAVEESYEDIVKQLNKTTSITKRKVINAKGKIVADFNIYTGNKVGSYSIKKLKAESIMKNIMRSQEFRNMIVNGTGNKFNLFMYVLGNRGRFNTDFDEEQDIINNWLGSAVSELFAKNTVKLLKKSVLFYNVNGATIRKSEILKRMKKELKPKLDFYIYNSSMSSFTYEKMDVDKNKTTPKYIKNDEQFYRKRYGASEKYSSFVLKRFGGGIL